MNYSKITFLSFFALFLSLPAQAGFKDTLIRTLPKLALTASFGSTMYPSMMQYKTHLGMQRDFTQYGLSHDPERSAWATTILREHGLLSDTETAILGIDEEASPQDRSWQSQNDSVITTPTDLNADGNPVCALIHEEWHRRNHDAIKRIIFTTLTNGAGWLATAALLRKGSWSKTPTLLDSVGKSLVYYYGTHIGASSLTATALPPFQRYRERNADKFMMAHIKNPQDLSETAEFYNYRHEQYTDAVDKLPGYTQLYVAAYLGLFDTHPSNLERAEYFEKAAAELRTKQQSKKS